MTYGNTFRLVDTIHVNFKVLVDPLSNTIDFGHVAQEQNNFGRIVD